MRDSEKIATLEGEVAVLRAQLSAAEMMIETLKEELERFREFERLILWGSDSQ